MSEVQTSLKTFSERQEQFRKVRERICSILLDYPDGLTVAEITLRYIERFRHVARIDNRLRELRKDREVESYPTASGLVWILNREKWKRKDVLK